MPSSVGTVTTTMLLKNYAPKRENWKAAKGLFLCTYVKILG